MSGPHETAVDKLTQSSIVVILATAMSAAYTASEAVERLANPVFRWCVTISVAFACFVYWRSPKSREIQVVDANGDAISIVKSSNAALYCMVFAVAFVSTDMVFTSMGWVRVAHVSQPTFLPGRYVLAEESGEDEPLRLRRPVKPNGSYAPVVRRIVPEAWQGEIREPSVLFSVAKVSSVDEVIVDDILVEVLEWQPYDGGGHLASVTSILDGEHADSILRVIVPVSKDTESLPTDVSPSHIIGAAESDVVVWSRARITLRNDFARHIEVVPLFSKAGVYKFTASIVVRTNLSRRQVIPLFATPRTVTVVDFKMSREESGLWEWPKTQAPGPSI